MRGRPPVASVGEAADACGPIQEGSVGSPGRGVRLRAGVGQRRAERRAAGRRGRGRAVQGERRRVEHGAARRAGRQLDARAVRPAEEVVASAPAARRCLPAHWRAAARTGPAGAGAGPAPGRPRSGPRRRPGSAGSGPAGRGTPAPTAMRLLQLPHWKFTVCMCRRAPIGSLSCSESRGIARLAGRNGSRTASASRRQSTADGAAHGRGRPPAGAARRPAAARRIRRRSSSTFVSSASPLTGAVSQTTTPATASRRALGDLQGQQRVIERPERAAGDDHQRQTQFRRQVGHRLPLGQRTQQTADSFDQQQPPRRRSAAAPPSAISSSRSVTPGARAATRRGRRRRERPTA